MLRLAFTRISPQPDDRTVGRLPWFVFRPRAQAQNPFLRLGLAPPLLVKVVVDVGSLKFKAFFCGRASCKADGPTPIEILDHDIASGKRVLRMYAAGTSCTDVSSMGTQTGLLGPSSRPLAIFLSEIRHVLPAASLHLLALQTFEL